MKGLLLTLMFIIIIPSNAQCDIPIYNFDQLAPILEKQNDTLYLINFWASWCPPCVEEMPVIETVYQDYKQYPFSIILVSLDFPDQIETRLIPFLEENGINLKVILLNETQNDLWFKNVDKSWGGGIPASLIYLNNQKEFYEKPFTYNELAKIIQTKLELN